MIKALQLRINLHEEGKPDGLLNKAAYDLDMKPSEISGIKILRKSIDARKRNIMFNYKVEVYINEPVPETSDYHFEYKDVSKAKPIHIIGFGPAGMYAALRCIELGFKPIVFERGKNVQDRRRDLKAINQDHFVNEDSNYCFGGHADPTNGMRKDLMGDPGPAEGVINSPEDARKAVRQRYKNGADLIKITATGGVLSVAKNGKNAQFTQEEVNEIVKTAKEYGMVVAAHAHGKEGMKRAVMAGVQTIEHGSFMDKEVADLMKKNKTYLVPTISAGRYVEEKAKIPNYYPAVIIPKITSTMEVLDDTFKMVISEKVPVAFGTDAGVFPHGENAKEFTYMVEAGWTAMFSIQSATITNAMLLDMKNELGQIKEGYLADIIAVNADPTEDISTLENVAFVMKNGVIYKQ